MTCKDCMHFIVCEKACHLFDEPDVEKRCKHFKHKANFEEVKSCNECIFVDVPSGNMPCVECSNCYISLFEQKPKND